MHGDFAGGDKIVFSDLGGNPRISYSTVDLGAYEAFWLFLPVIRK